MQTILKYSFLVLVLTLAAVPLAYAHGRGFGGSPKPTPTPVVPTHTAPELDPSLAIGGLTLLAGSLAVVRARRSKR
jgi:hypothetical protein